MGKASLRLVYCFFLILCDPNHVKSNGVGSASQGETGPAENEEQGTIKPLLLHGYSTLNRGAKNGKGSTAGGTESGNEANEVENETGSVGQGSKPLPRPNNNNFGNRGRSDHGTYNNPYYYDGSSRNDRSTHTLRRYGSDFGMQNTWSEARSGYTVGPYDNRWNDGFTTTSAAWPPTSPHYPDTTEDD